MKKWILLLAAISSVALLGGCSKGEDTPSQPATDASQANNAKPGANGNPTAANQQSGTSGGGQSGIAPMTSPSAGGLTPVAGTDSVAGASGGGVQQAAKDQARRVGAGSSSLDQLPKDEGQ